MSYTVKRLTDDVTLTRTGNDITVEYQTSGVANFAVKRIDGGLETINTVAAAGTTETLDLGDGNVHDVTLDENVEFTFTGATSGVACSFTLILRQDGAGGNSVTWPASVDWAGGTAPTISTTGSTVNVLTFLTADNGTTWLGFASGLSMA